MDVHVDQAGHQRLARQVDVLDSGPQRTVRASAIEVIRPVVVDEDRRMIDIAAGSTSSMRSAVTTVAAVAGAANRNGRGGGQQQALHQIPPVPHVRCE